MMQMSWLVQAAVRAAMPDGMLKGAAMAAADALLEAWPADDQPEWLARSLRSCAETLRHAAGDLLWQGGCHALLLRAGQSLDAARLAGPAVAYWQELAATGERMLGLEHPVFFQINERLAQAYLAAGQAAVAVSLLQWVWSERARRRGPDHPGTIEAARNLGLALVSAGRFNEAVVVLTEVVSGRERSQGVNSLDALTAHEDLGAAYRAAGSIFEAIMVYRRTLAERERIQGQRHPDVTATRQQLAEAYLADGRPKAAIAQYEKVVSDRERELGPDHLLTVAARGALGAACHAGGKMAAAVRLGEQTRTGYTRLLGVDHPDTLAASLNLAQRLPERRPQRRRGQGPRGRGRALQRHPDAVGSAADRGPDQLAERRPVVARPPGGTRPVTPGVTADADQPGSLSRWTWKNGDRSQNRATSIMSRPEMRMPATDQFCAAGAVVMYFTTIQTRNPADASGRMPRITASQAPEKTRRR